jgi:L-lactate dehydrogenase
MNVAVVGTGNVGSALLFHLADVPGVEKIFVMNLNDDWSYAAIMDVASAKPVHASRFCIAPFSRLGEADVIALTSGAQMKAGQTGKDVQEENIRIMEAILDSTGLKTSAIIIALATPVDNITAFIQKRYQLPVNQVMGFGGDLDRNRLTYVLQARGKKVGDIQVIGEHGGRTIPVYQDQEDFEEVADKVRNFLGEITTQGGRPRNLATGLLFARLIDSVVNNANRVHTVSGFYPDYGLYITWPFQIGRNGVGAPQPVSITGRAAESLNELIAYKREEIERIANGRALSG